MANISRRKFIASAVAAAAGASGLTAAAIAAQHHGLIPPDAGKFYGAGETLTYATHRLLTRNSMAREFSRSEISEHPFANSVDPLGDEFKRLEADSFRDWRISVDGMAERATTFSLADIRSFPTSTQITMLGCEEGWTYIAEWSGVPLSYVLERVGALPKVRYVVYHSFQHDWFDAIDMADALHPQTLLALRMNGHDLPVPHGGPVRMRVPRQLGYKSTKYITRITLTDDLTPYHFADSSYAWYAGI
jgi:DMSO/TMAO reductase YedYZ molybdopterin-dependent catalytic subunit